MRYVIGKKSEPVEAHSSPHREMFCLDPLDFLAQGK